VTVKTSGEPSLVDVFEAKKRIQSELFPVQPRLSATLTEYARRDVWLIPECLQRTGSFKFRGALNRMMIHAARAGGPVITASSGNHAIGLTVAAGLTGTEAIVIVPERASEAKLATLKAIGANVMVMGEGFDEAENLMFAYAEQHGIEIVNSFDSDVVAGHATAAIEALAHLPDLDALLAPVASGGLLAGCALVANALAPGCQVFGVQTSAWPAMHKSLRNGELTLVAGDDTYADGLAGNAMRSTLPFQIMQRLVPDVFLVDEAAILNAIRHTLLHDHLVVEGAGAATVAAVREKCSVPGTGPIGVILSGGNATEASIRAALDA
jgi:threonine dehydratase